MAWALSILGQVARTQGDDLRARTLTEEALPRFQQLLTCASIATTMPTDSGEVGSSCVIYLRSVWARTPALDKSPTGAFIKRCIGTPISTQLPCARQRRRCEQRMQPSAAS
jgi:hypothetical protein